MDHLYQDAKSKSSILGDIKTVCTNRSRAQRDIQKTLSNSKTSMQYVLDSSHNSSKTSVQTKEMLFFRMCRAWSAIRTASIRISIFTAEMILQQLRFL